MKKIMVFLLLSVFIMSCAATPEKKCFPKTVILKGVNFESDRSRLTPESYPILDEDVALMKTHPKMTITISGHTDSVGDASYNQRLSRDRANAVKQYFIQKGIGSDRIQAIGKGESTPIADNKSEAGRAQNRRIEIQFADPDPEVVCQ